VATEPAGRPVEDFEANRRRLFSMAYRMLGSASDAEDAVQDAFLRWNGADPASIDKPGAWLATALTNLCLTRLTSARARREHYVGLWLPEPVLTDGGTLGPLETVEQRDSVSFALLVLLERLTPTERAVFVLREAFGYHHREIAGVLNLSEANCRQVFHRARRHLDEAPLRPRFQPSEAERRRLVKWFLAAARDGDLTAMEEALAADVRCWTDGGDRIAAARRPLNGRSRVARYLGGLVRKMRGGMAADVAVAVAEVNGAPAMLVLLERTLTGVVLLDVRDGGIGGIHLVVNPDKLGYLAGQLSVPVTFAGATRSQLVTSFTRRE
jgi:RNA polymerase sigma-70 factor (ECF subfamily)